MEIDTAKMELINGFFETYLTLNESEEKELMEDIKQLDREELKQILKLPNSWRDKGKLEQKKEIAINMLKEGTTIEFIEKVTKLDYAEIEELKKEL